MNQLRATAAIVALRQVGMPLPEIAALIDSDRTDAIHELLAAHRRRLAAQLVDAERRLTLIEAMITEEIGSMYDITVSQIPPIRIVSERLDVPSHLSAVSEAATLTGLGARLAHHGVEPVGQPIIVIHHADEQRTREDACLPIADEAVVPDEFHVEVLPGGPMATATHVGPFGDLAFVVNAVMGWVAGAGHRVSMPFRVQLLSVPPLFTVAAAGGGDQPVAQVFVPFDQMIAPASFSAPILSQS